MTTLISTDRDRLSSLLTRIGTTVRVHQDGERPRVSASQLAHLQHWNGLDGVRSQASRAGVLTLREAAVLEEALNEWPWQDKHARRDIGRVVNLLFLIRKDPGFDKFDRSRFADYPNLQPCPRTSTRRDRRKPRRRINGGGWG